MSCSQGGFGAGVVAVCLLAAALPAGAQTAPGTWTVEITGGVMRPFDVGGGDVTLPPAGAPIVTTNPTYPSRQVPTWFLGDGALLLNQVNAALGVPAAIAPLDDALAATGLRTGAIGAAGVRILRQVSPRYAVQVSLDVLPGAAGVPDQVREAAIASAAGFESAFAGLLGNGPFGSIDVSASTSSSAGAGRELALIGAVQYSFDRAGGFDPFMTLGGGIIAGIGEASSLTLDGRYRAVITGEGAAVPIEERDRLTVSYEYRTALVGVLGGGVRRAIGDRWGLVVDGRVFFGQHASRVVLDSAPEVAVGTPADYIESFTTPAIQFSNDPATGRVSTLGAPGLDGFEAFVANGLQVRAILTAGVFVRF